MDKIGFICLVGFIVGIILLAVIILEVFFGDG